MSLSKAETLFDGLDEDDKALLLHKTQEQLLKSLRHYVKSSFTPFSMHPASSGNKHFLIPVRQLLADIDFGRIKKGLSSILEAVAQITCPLSGLSILSNTYTAISRAVAKATQINEQLNAISPSQVKQG